MRWSSARGACVTSAPSNSIVPASGSISRMRQRASVVLPLPGLSDDAERLAARDLERDAVDGDRASPAGAAKHAEPRAGERLLADPST